MVDQLVSDFLKELESNSCSSRQLVRVYIILAHMYDLPDPESKKTIEDFTDQIVKYWVANGFDSD